MFNLDLRKNTQPSVVAPSTTTERNPSWPSLQCLRVDRIVPNKQGDMCHVIIYVTINNGTVTEIECSLDSMPVNKDFGLAVDEATVSGVL